MVSRLPVFITTFFHSLHVKFTFICIHILTYSIYVFSREKGGGGGVMNLVYGSSSSSYMDCEVNFVLSVADSPVWGSFIPVLLHRRLRRGPHHNWMFLLRFHLLQDEY